VRRQSKMKNTHQYRKHYTQRRICEYIQLFITERILTCIHGLTTYTNLYTYLHVKAYTSAYSYTCTQTYRFTRSFTYTHMHRHVLIQIINAYTYTYIYVSRIHIHIRLHIPNVISYYCLVVVVYLCSHIIHTGYLFLCALVLKMTGF
jgi:hypothetical protein